jgi:hypothetical protein
MHGIWLCAKQSRSRTRISITVLEMLRGQLDELDEFKEEALTGITKEDRAEIVEPLGQYLNDDDEREVEEEQYRSIE